jgi:hypothetical protein
MFVRGLIGSGFELNNEKNTLLWLWDIKRGQMRAAYDVRVMENMKEDTNFWYNKLWRWQLPFKVILFIWLMLEQKILTWETLIKRDIIGPSRCSRCALCGNTEEIVYHLFVECSFTKNIEFTIIKELKTNSTWKGGHITE